MGKRYSITVRGFDACDFIAESAGKARYACYRAWREAGYGPNVSFGDFIRHKIETFHHMGEEHGDPRTPKYGVAA